MRLPDAPISEKDIDALGMPLENDLLALFKLMEEDAIGLLMDAQEKGWTPEEVEREIEALIMGDNRNAIA